MSDSKEPVLTDCPVCNGKVSSDAKSCPHCGHPFGRTEVSLKTSRACLVSMARGIKRNTPSIIKFIRGGIVKAFRFCCWLVIVGILGTIGHCVADFCLDIGHVGCVFLAIMYPALFTIPGLAAAGALVGERFKKSLSFLCSVFCTLSSPVLFRGTASTGVKNLDVTLSIVDVVVALLWSVYFFTFPNPSKPERVLKRILLVFNLIVAMFYSVIIVTGWN